jgi:hypothetical protein
MKIPTKTPLLLPLLASVAIPSHALILDVTINGSDAIFLAGRTDLSIPDANQPWTGPSDYLIRHGDPTPEEIQETLPQTFVVQAGDIIRALDPAVGGISFFNGLGNPFYGPSGNGLSGSSLTPLGGLSGYIGPQGALAGVFLTDAIPDSGAPETLDFSPAGLGIDFTTLSPMIGQIFYIGDGKTSGDIFQTFIAPASATRLALGIPDGFGFNGAPGAYDDNDGSYRIRLGINEIPTGEVTEPSSLALLVLGLVSTGLLRKRYSR